MSAEMFFQSLPCILITYLFFYTTTGSSSSSTRTYYPTAVTSADLLNATTVEVATNVSRIICAAKASQKEVCHLFCYTSQLCSLYDVTVPRRSASSVDGFLRTCWTDDATFTETGENKSSTTTTSAVSTTTAPAENSRSCGQGFADVPGVGSLCFDENQMSMSSAKSACSSYNARLVTPLIFETLRLYVVGLQKKGTAYWLGVQNGLWLDGRPVLELATSTLTGAAGCAYMDGGRTFGIYGVGCSSTMGAICQLN